MVFCDAGESQSVRAQPLRQNLNIFMIMAMLAIGGCADSQTVCSISTEEYRVFEAVLSSRMIGIQVDTILFCDSTLMLHPGHTPRLRRLGSPFLSFTSWLQVRQLYPDFGTDEFAKAFDSVNASRCALIADSFHVRRPVRIKVCAEGFGPLSYRDDRLPQIGLFWFSRVGFDSSMTGAVVYCEVDFTHGNDRGDCYWLKKRNGTWEVFQSQQSWSK
jgi:hypothetical protein